MADGLRIHFEEPDFTIGTYENALLWSFRGDVLVERIRRSIPLHEELVREYPQGIALMTILRETVPLSMPNDARDLSTSIAKEYQKRYCGLCEVIEGGALRSAIAWSITHGIRLVARPPCPSELFRDVAAASRWLAPLMTTPPRVEELTRELTAAAQRVRQPPP